MYTKILCGWVELPGDCPTDRAKCEHSLTGDPAELHSHVRHSGILPSYGTEEVSAAALLLPSWDIPFAGSDRLYKREAESDLVTGTDRLHAVRTENAQLANDLPLDL